MAGVRATVSRLRQRQGRVRRPGIRMCATVSSGPVCPTEFRIRDFSALTARRKVT
jgi:hypothetical protein